MVKRWEPVGEVRVVGCGGGGCGMQGCGCDSTHSTNEINEAAGLLRGAMESDQHTTSVMAKQMINTINTGPTGSLLPSSASAKLM